MREEIEAVALCDRCFEHNDVLACALKGEYVAHDDLIAATRDKCLWLRLSARLEAELTRLTAGTKPEAM